MPFRSKKQQRFMYATKPKGVDLKEWAEETNFEKLPEKVRKKKKDKNDSLDPISEDPSLNPQPDDPFTTCNAALVYTSMTAKIKKIAKAVDMYLIKIAEVQAEEA